MLAACSAPMSDEAAKDEGATGRMPSDAEQTSPASSSSSERNAYFGDLHVHTRYSYDAFVFGTREDPDAAYEFAKGNAITHPAGFALQLDRPLDFQAVADHANYLGMLPAMLDPDSPAYDHPAAETVRNATTAAERQGIFAAMQPYVRYMRDSDPSSREHLNMDVVRSAWSEIIAAANRHNDPGTFTAFIGYEYTSAGVGGVYNNLHRNVVFRGDRGPAVPFSRLDSFNPEDLWSKMDEWREAGLDALAIPHNMNGSGGRMFEYEYFDGGTIDDAYVEQRTRNEPIAEMTQAKGTSETHPALSPNDEWADFEIMPYRISGPLLLSEPTAGGYMRDGLRRGLTIEAGGVDNPYKLGFIGSSDTHVAAGVFREDDYTGPSGVDEAQRRGSVPIVTTGPAGAAEAVEGVDDGSGRTYLTTRPMSNGASGLAGVWAEENTRESLFDAMRRKETFATSGPRILVRFFAGVGIGGLDLSDPSLISKAYEEGVPMGGDLFGSDGDSPSFLVWAMRDSLGAPLQRVQVVKGWLEGETTHERVYDVACSDGATVAPETHRCPDNGARVDLETCAISEGRGAAELKTLWLDPDFDAGERAFYYVRALENPTCRWSTWDALRAGVEPRRDFPATIQDRAWSSPIWYTP